MHTVAITIKKFNKINVFSRGDMSFPIDHYTKEDIKSSLTTIEN